MCWITINYVIVFSIGAIWGLLELLLKFNDWKYLLCRKVKKKGGKSNSNQSVPEDEYEGSFGYVFWYLFLNGITAVLTLYILLIIKNEKLEDSISISNILIAGLGGMTLLRSSIMTISINNKDVVIGLVSVVESFMEKINNKINHNMAAKRICEIYDIMKDVDYDKAKDELPVLCMSYIDYFPEEDQNKLIQEIASINTGLDNINKSLQLGREIAKYCEVEILKRAVKKLPHIKVSTINHDDNGVEEKDVYELKIDKLSAQWKQKRN